MTKMSMARTKRARTREDGAGERSSPGSQAAALKRLGVIGGTAVALLGATFGYTHFHNGGTAGVTAGLVAPTAAGPRAVPPNRSHRRHGPRVLPTSGATRNPFVPTQAMAAVLRASTPTTAAAKQPRASSGSGTGSPRTGSSGAGAPSATQPRTPRTTVPKTYMAPGDAEALAAGLSTCHAFSALPQDKLTKGVGPGLTLADDKVILQMGKSLLASSKTALNHYASTDTPVETVVYNLITDLFQTSGGISAYQSGGDTGSIALKAEVTVNTACGFLRRLQVSTLAQ
jgi:hypothetical protein